MISDLLTGRVAAVTGAARGLGAAIAATFERAGAIVVRLDVLDVPGVIRCGWTVKPSPVTLRLLEMLDDVTTLQPTLLEIGCGTGAASVLLAQHGARRVTGFDLSPASVEIALRRAANAGLDSTQVRFVVGDGASSALDQHVWVLLDRVICCYPNAERLLANAVDAAGDRLAFAVPESRGWRGLLNRVGWGAENLWGSAFRRSMCPGHVHDLDGIHGILVDAGLQMSSEAHRGLWYAAVFERRTSRFPLGEDRAELESR